MKLFNILNKQIFLILIPFLKELFDVAVKNDDNLLKLATGIQRIMSKHQLDDSEVSLLSDDEKEELMSSLEDAASELQKKSDDIDISKIKEKYNT